MTVRQGCHHDGTLIRRKRFNNQFVNVHVHDNQFIRSEFHRQIRAHAHGIAQLYPK